MNDKDLLIVRMHSKYSVIASYTILPSFAFCFEEKHLMQENPLPHNYRPSFGYTRVSLDFYNELCSKFTM